MKANTRRELRLWGKALTRVIAPIVGSVGLIGYGAHVTGGLDALLWALGNR